MGSGLAKPPTLQIEHQNGIVIKRHHGQHQPAEQQEKYQGDALIPCHGVMVAERPVIGEGAAHGARPEARYFACIFLIMFSAARFGMKGITPRSMTRSLGSLMARNSPFSIAL